MHKHISLSILPIPSHQPSCIDGAHPTWGLIIIPGGGVHHNQIPLHLEYFLRQPLESQEAVRLPGVHHFSALLRHTGRRHQLVGLAELGVVDGVVGLQCGELLLDLVDPPLVLL
uniref:Uncharacterized protein n=1 Tax=Opuntia streptacantha TaxID=393608 RepID=A0A7C9D0P3_OPUST